MKKYASLLLAMLLAFPVIAQQPAADKRLSGLEKDMDQLLKDWHAAGFAVAIVEKDKIIYSKGFGYRDYEQKKPATANTLFAIGSSTKAFTCGLIGILQDDGKLSIDNKIRDYLPTLRFYNDKMDAAITLRDMMCHRTGLPRHDFSWYLFNTPDRESMLKRVQYMEPSAEVRAKWQYNNFMFLAQGVLVEKLTGHSWEDNIKTQFFDKLDMQRSNLTIRALQQDADASFGYEVRKDSLIRKMDYYDIAGMGPAGSINSSVNEMAHWLMAWINGGKYAGKGVLPVSYIREAITPQMVTGSGLPGRDHPDLHVGDYGLGWFLSSYRGHYRVEHGGNIDGFSANVAFFPSDSLGVVVLCNQNSSMLPAMARNLIADRMLKLKYINWSGERVAEMRKAEKSEAEAEKAATPPVKTAKTSPTHALKDYEGLYSNPGYGEVEVYLRNDSLYGKSPQRNFFLRHRLYDIFDLKWIDKTDGPDTSAGGTPLTFRYDESGKISSFEIAFEGGVKPIEFTYKPKAKALSREELERYAGSYELSGVVIRVFIKNRSLFLSVPGQPDYETVPTGDHHFALKDLSGYSVVFEMGANNIPVAVSFIQPNGTFKAKRKE